jgi:hypothetical protein
VVFGKFLLFDDFLTPRSRRSESMENLTAAAMKHTMETSKSHRKIALDTDLALLAELTQEPSKAANSEKPNS